MKSEVIKPEKGKKATEIEKLLLRNYYLPLENNKSRSSLTQKIHTLRVVNLCSKFSEKPVSSKIRRGAKALTQVPDKKKKVEIENELKKNRQRPSHSSNTRKIPEKLNIKVLGIFSSKKHSFSNRISEEDILEIEKDIELLESCLNLNDKKDPVKDSEEKKKKIGSGASKRENSKNLCSRKPANCLHQSKTPVEVPNPVLKASWNSRKFIKSNSPMSGKNRSCSMENLLQLNFTYRSLSPFHITLKRNNK